MCDIHAYGKDLEPQCVLRRRETYLCFVSCEARDPDIAARLQDMMPSVFVGHAVSIDVYRDIVTEISYSKNSSFSNMDNAVISEISWYVCVLFTLYLHILKINLEHQFIYICFP